MHRLRMANRDGFIVAGLLMLLNVWSGPLAAEDLLAGIPAPADSQVLGTGSVSSGGQKASYATPAAPGKVVAAYRDALTAAGWTVLESGGSESSYGGGGGGLEATNGPKYLSVHAGGPQGKTFVDLCVWPAKPDNTNCGDN